MFQRTKQLHILCSCFFNCAEGTTISAVKSDDKRTTNIQKQKSRRFVRITGILFKLRIYVSYELLHSFFNSNCASNCCTNHRVVTHVDGIKFTVTSSNLLTLTKLEITVFLRSAGNDAKLSVTYFYSKKLKFG